MGLGRNLLLWSIRLRWEFSGDYFFRFDSPCRAGFALTTFCPQRCRIQPWHAVASSRGLPGTLNQGASASADSRSFMRQLAMRKHWLLLTCSCVATAMAPPRLARRRFIGAATAFVPGLAVGANLPSDNGAKGDQRGTVAALVPIVRVASSVLQASRAVQAGKLQDAQKALDAIPATEKPFKRLFDEYSEPVSYKQKYKDSNAFVVYYTQGFDGAGRPSIEAPDAKEERQTRQYGYRNDAWAAVDDARAEVKYCIDEKADTAELTSMLKRASAALDGYLGLAPSSDVAAARAKL